MSHDDPVCDDKKYVRPERVVVVDESGSAPDFFAGRFDGDEGGGTFINELRVYGRALAASEVKDLARLWRAHGRQNEADDFLRRAERAYAWAQQHPMTQAESPGQYARFYLNTKAYAAAQLLRTTCEATYQVDFAGVNAWSMNPAAELSRHGLYDQRLAAWAYVNCDAPPADPALQDLIKRAIIAEADYFIEHCATMVYRFIRHPMVPISWGTGGVPEFSRFHLLGV